MDPSTGFVINLTSKIDTSLSLASTACALERYFLKHNVYPENLQALVPEFTKEVPQDPMDHQPMRYQKTGDGRYQLHSIGWDGVDDQGGEGNITWNYQTPQP